MVDLMSKPCSGWSTVTESWDGMVRAGPRSIEPRRELMGPIDISMPRRELIGPIEGLEDRVPPGGNKAAPGAGTAQKRRHIRMMLPINICCNKCGNRTNKGTKFNSSMEDVPGETYSGIQIFRFRFSCGKCAAELVMKSDPENSDFVMEAGASRINEPRPATDEAHLMRRPV
ncbi:hypothetical protein M758_8G117300 [Ceratodon purpureus]|nr:hypothetical protein M758_8G117300 [Ceratodon purpureus]